MNLENPIDFAHVIVYRVVADVQSFGDLFLRNSFQQMSEDAMLGIGKQIDRVPIECFRVKIKFTRPKHRRSPGRTLCLRTRRSLT